MATRSRLRMVLPSGKAKAIYCHWDGHPSHQMPILKEHYNTDEKVEELMDLGAISYLAPKVKPAPGQEHSFNKPAKDVVVAYHRDRGEDLQLGCEREEFNYLWNGTEWVIE